MKTFFALIFCCFTLMLSAQSGNGTFHEVEAGETKYGIAREYGISIELLEKYNPDLKAGLREGMQLFIPKTSSETQSEKEEQDTSKFVYHTVKEGETLYSLSKDYGVDYAKMKALNPGLEDGLKLGQVLKLPKPVKQETLPIVKDSSFVYHIVREGETAYSLSKQYGVSLDSLYLLNPEASGVLRLGQELKFKKRFNQAGQPLPNAGLNSDADERPEVPEGDEYFLYKVKSGDTYYSFKKKFKVSRAELLELNPELAEGLTVGRYIILPNKGENEDAAWLDQLFSEVEGEEQSPKKSNEQPGVEEKPKAVDIDTLRVDYLKQYRIALLLPFFAPSTSDTLFDYTLGFEKRSMVAMEFYQGFMLAVDSMNNSGMNITLEVMDTKNSKVAVDSKINELRFSKPDLIVGPLFKDHVERVAEAFGKEGTPVISPLSNAVEVKGHPNLIKCINSPDAFSIEVAQILNKAGGKRNIIFAHTAAADELEKMKQIKARIKAINSDVSFDELVGTQDDQFVVGAYNTRSTLVQGKKNIFIALSEREVFLADLVNQLHSVRDTSIQLIAPSRVMKINALEYKYLNALQFTMPDGNFTDAEAPATMRFNKKFSEAYKVLPSRFAYQGYDVGMYFLSQLWQYGPYMTQSLGAPKEGVSTGFSFVKNKEGGYENVFMFTTALKDYQLKRVR